MLFINLIISISPAMPLEILQAPKDITTVEKQKVSFTAKLNKPGVPVKWFKDAKEVSEYEVSSADCEYTLTIPSTKMDMTGTFTIKAEDKSADAKLTVNGE